MPTKPQLYRCISEGNVYLGGKVEVNNLPEPFKKLFIEALKDAAEGKTPSPFNVPPAILEKAGFKTEGEVTRSPEAEEEPEEPEPGEVIPVKSLKEIIQKPRRVKSFVDILAEKIADKILERLMG